MKKYSAVLLILAMVLSFTVIACNPTVIVGGEFYDKTQTVQRTGDDVVLTLSVKQNSGSPFVVTINQASADYSVAPIFTGNV